MEVEKESDKVYYEIVDRPASDGGTESFIIEARDEENTTYIYLYALSASNRTLIAQGELTAEAVVRSTLEEYGRDIVAGLILSGVQDDHVRNICEAIRITVERGATVEEMRQSIPILDEICRALLVPGQGYLLDCDSQEHKQYRIGIVGNSGFISIILYEHHGGINVEGPGKLVLAYDRWIHDGRDTNYQGIMEIIVTPNPAVYMLEIQAIIRSAIQSGLTHLSIRGILQAVLISSR